MTLKEFLEQKMQMSGIYQPLIIRHLLNHDGQSTLLDLARELAGHDEEVLSYYEEKLKKHPKEVLAKHRIASLVNGQFAFQQTLEYGAEKVELIKICDEKIKAYLDKIPTTEQNNSGWGRKRIELIEKHPFCTLCGAKPNRDEVFLDIDHIRPRSEGGTDDISNLQVLCHRCNRAKGNSLIKSSKQVHIEHLGLRQDCIFCQTPESEISFENEYIYEKEDRYPVTPGHRLIISKRHVSDATDLTPIELQHMFDCLKKTTAKLKLDDPSILGFNTGFNIGQSAGQTVMHTHLHVIPRRKNDVENPRGGIRGVIPGKADY